MSQSESFAVVEVSSKSSHVQWWWLASTTEIVLICLRFYVASTKIKRLFLYQNTWPRFNVWQIVQRCRHTQNGRPILLRFTWWRQLMFRRSAFRGWGVKSGQRLLSLLTQVNTSYTTVPGVLLLLSIHSAHTVQCYYGHSGILLLTPRFLASSRELALLACCYS